jgi:uncharacterized protein (DUF2249 family)
VDLDVRDDIRQGREPFARIVTAARALGPDQVLVLRAPFEPRPLFDVLGRRGFAHWSECHAPGDWSVWFFRAPPDVPAPGPGTARQPDTVRIDVRGLEPPEPMVRVLELLDDLDAGQSLEVTHDRRPLFLYPQLDERGFAHETDEPEPGVFRIRIRGAARG